MHDSKTEELINQPSLTKGLTRLLAMGGGISVANIYYNQPLLADMSKTFHTTADSVGLISTLTQLGYALGLFFFVPLGDIKDKRKLILTLNVLVAISLLGVASAQNLFWMYLASLAVGMTAVIQQVMIPLATQLAKPEERGKVIGTIVSGLLIGILMARTVSGYVGYLAGWRTMFVISSVLMFLLAIILYFKLPTVKSNGNLTYKELLKSILIIFRKYTILKKASITQVMMFGAFSVFWTTMVFLLENPPYNFHSNQAGLFGLLGVAGAMAASIIGRLNDKKDPRIIIVICIVISLISFLTFSFFSMKLWGIIIGVILLDLGIQGAQISNQTRIFSINEEERSRINTVYTVSNFIGGAAGSLLAAHAWNSYGWPGVCFIGITMILIALVINLLNRN